MRLWPNAKPGIPIGTYGTILRRHLRLTDDNARSHIRVIGKSGSGKSRWLAGFCVNLMRAGYSFTLIDPHGDLSRLVLSALVADGFFDRNDAYDRLRYLDIPTAAKHRRYLKFNVLSQPYDTHTTARLTLDAMRRAYPELDGTAPAFKQIVTAATHVLVANKLPISRLRDLLLDVNKDWRDRLLANVADPLIASFFHDEYDQYNPDERKHLRGSTMRRLFDLLYSPVLRFALAAEDNLLEYRSILERNQSLIVNLAVQDPDARRLLGCLMTVYAEHGAKSRADLPPGTRFGTHFLVLDEFHDFVSQSAAQLTSMLSETRKFNLFAVLSHQTLDQVPDRMRSGLQNVEVDITFRTGRDDAEQQAKVVGNVDPFSVKHEVAEHQERSHPTFFPLQEQWEGWTQQLTRLKKRVAFIRDPSGSVTTVQSLDMPDPVVDPARLATIEAHYLNECFYPASFQRLDETIPLFAAAAPFVPAVDLAA